MEILLEGRAGGGGGLEPPKFREGRLWKGAPRATSIVSSMQISEDFGSNLLMGGGWALERLTIIGGAPPPPPWSDTVTVTGTGTDCDSARGVVM